MDTNMIQAPETRALPRDCHYAVLARPCRNETFDLRPNETVTLRDWGYVEVCSTAEDGDAILRYRTSSPARGMDAPDGAVVKVRPDVLALFPARTASGRGMAA